MDKANVFEVLLNDLSKNKIECLPLELIIGKLNGYGFSFPTLKLIQNKFSNRFQRTKITHTKRQY